MCCCTAIKWGTCKEGQKWYEDVQRLKEGKEAEISKTSEFPITIVIFQEAIPK